MALPSRHKWIFLTILAIIIPTGLLTAFKLTGIIPEPSEPETITLEPVNWIMDRPSTYNLNLDEKFESAYADSEAAVGIGANVAWYVENPDPSVGPFFGRDGVCFVIYVNFSALRGSGVSITVKCRPTDDNATIYVENELQAYHNVSVTGITWYGNSTHEACITAKALGSSCYLRAQAYWVFNDQNNENHMLDLAFEITYFNGTTYIRLILPVSLQMLIPTTTKGR